MEPDDRNGVIWWALLPAILAALGYALLPVQSWDYWWHVTIGRLIADTGAVPDRALFLYTMESDAPSVLQPWASQWFLYVIHDTFGLRANLLLRGVVIGASFGGATWWGARRSGRPMTAGLVGVAGLVLAFPFLDLRTSLFALPLFVMVVGVAEAVGDGALAGGWIWSIPFVALAWANLHGSFLLPAVVCATYAVSGLVERSRGAAESGTRPRRWAGCAALSLVAPVVNPNGVDVYRYVYDVATDPVVQSTVTEWFPTTPFFPTFAGPIFYLILVAAALALWEQRDELVAADVILIVGFGILAATQARGLVWFGLLLPPALAPYLRLQTTRWRPSDRTATAGKSLAALGGAVVLALQPVWPWWSSVVTSYRAVPVRDDAPYRGAVPSEAPVEAIDALTSDGSETLPRIFHDERYAGFLLFHLLDRRVERIVFVDQRVELPPVEVWRQYFEASRGENWEEVFEIYGVDAAVVHRRRQSDLVDALAESEAWQAVARNEATVTYVRSRRELTRAVRRPIPRADRCQPASRSRRPGRADGSDDGRGRFHIR